MEDDIIIGLMLMSDYESKSVLSDNISFSEIQYFCSEFIHYLDLVNSLENRQHLSDSLVIIELFTWCMGYWGGNVSFYVGKERLAWHWSSSDVWKSPS